MHHATSLLYHVCAVASRNIRFASCGTSGKLTLWTCLVHTTLVLPFLFVLFPNISVPCFLTLSSATRLHVASQIFKHASTWRTHFACSLSCVDILALRFFTVQPYIPAIVGQTLLQDASKTHWSFRRKLLSINFTERTIPVRWDAFFPC
jgi:hypothetical protein